MVCIALLCACTTSTTEYPSSWPRTRVGGMHCEDASGVYLEQGVLETALRTGERIVVSLSDVLIGDLMDPTAPGISSRTVQLQVSPEGKLSASVSGEGTQRSALPVSMVENHCTDGMLVASFPKAKVGCEGCLAGRRSTNVRLERAEDDSLIVWVASTDVTLQYVVIPSSDREIYWMRFARAKQ